MWEEFPEGGCWIIRIKRKVSQSYVNRMWENLLLACIGEAFELPDVVGCVLSTRMKDDVLSIWNLSNQNNTARFTIGERLKEVLDLDMNALIQYKDHMQSLQDYSTYRNAKNYMFAPSPSVTPLQGHLETPIVSHQGDGGLGELDDDGMLPPAAIDDMLPPAAIDSEVLWTASGAEAPRDMGRSPLLSAEAPPWQPNSVATKQSPPLSPEAPPWFPPTSDAATAAPAPGAEGGEGAAPSPKSYAAIAAAAAANRGPAKSSPKSRPSS